MRVKLYLQVKENESEFAMYPLHIDTTYKMIGAKHYFDAKFN